VSCVDEIKARGWRVERTDDGEWSEWRHKCPKCRKAEAERFMNEKITRLG
jgi:hypothetical protein